MNDHVEARNLPVCIICGADVRPVLDLGRQPLANSLLRAADAPFETYPLGFAFCPACAHGQQTHFVDPRAIFADYLYASGTSRTLRDFFTWFAGKVVASLGTGVRVLELASNDGSLLDALRAAGLDPMGIDPAQNLCEVAAAKGHKVKCGFFPAVRPDTSVDLVVAMNVLAHTPDPAGFMAGVSECLVPGGMALIQTSQANMIANGEFDTIYHEHYSFYSARSMSVLARSAGLTLERVELVSVHGTSFMFTLRKPGGSGRNVDFAGAGGFLVPMPQPLPPLFDPACAPDTACAAYEDFAAAADRTMQATARLVSGIASEGKSIGLVGVAAKALTFINAARIEPSHFFDEAPLKIGRFVPGATAAIRPLSDLAELDEDIVLLIGSWNFAVELTEKIGSVVAGSSMEHRVSIVVHLPELRRFDL